MDLAIGNGLPVGKATRHPYTSDFSFIRLIPMKQRLLLFLGILWAGIGSLQAQCVNILANPGFEQGTSDWWTWHDNNPDAYSFEASTDAFTGAGSAKINVLVDTDSLTATNGAEYNSRPQTNPVEQGKTYQIEFVGKSTVPNTNLIIYIKDEFDNWATLLEETVTVDTAWTQVGTTWVADTNRADVHVEIKVYNADFHDPYSIWIDDVNVCTEVPVAPTSCANNVLANGGFEDGAFTDWWTWHDGDPLAYVFETSTDAFVGSSSAKIEVLVPSDSLTGTNGAEFNSRPQTNAIVAGESYTLEFTAKSTQDSTDIYFFIKDENDSWATVFSETYTVGADWTTISTPWIPDSSRNDVHVEIKVYNPDFDMPYSIWLDEVAICAPDTTPPVATLTCDENVVTNPGFESGVDTDWWNWHSNNPDSYSFETSDMAYVGDSSALIRVLDSSTNITGPAEYNSRPQVTALDTGSYQLTFWAKSTEANTEMSAWVKDEFDNWTTLFNQTFVIGTDWTEATAVFKVDSARDDVHLELKVYNPTFTAAYEVYIDEVSLCPIADTVVDPGPIDTPAFEPIVYGTTTDATDCNNELSPSYHGFEDPDQLFGWDLWDGNVDEVLATVIIDSVNPGAGALSARVDVNADNNVAEFHHRFGEKVAIEKDEEYTLTMWIRAETPNANDTVDVYTRFTRDTDWEVLTAAHLYVLSDEWHNFTHTWTASESWAEGFLEMKAGRKNGFTDAYTVWYDQIELCKTNDLQVVGVDPFQDLALDLRLYPNPTQAFHQAQLEITSVEHIGDAQVSMTDLAGRVLWQEAISLRYGFQQLAIPTANLSAGLYLVHLSHQGIVQTLKLQVMD